ncbi:MAG TPA: 2-C-methyl-D-erythritol 4-phosphate cytidylyltransferase [Thiotrichaceae bacterium]|nr:2-C-methyl-D-erythritol 4-phosphate cytidylyltransferase [Thiotrichaceae bacterium]
MNTTSDKNSLWVIIPAAGIGRRMQSTIPKQYLSLVGKTVLEHTLHCFSQHSDIAGIIIALHPDDPYWADLSIDIDLPLHIVDGGIERVNSVLNGLQCYLQLEGVDPNSFILIHDAARPCLSQDDLNTLLAARAHCGQAGAILAAPVSDTMKRASAQNTQAIDHTVSRDRLWRALTPQMFPAQVLMDAITQANVQQALVTDEASALECCGQQPMLVEGSAANIKITRPDDLALAEFFLQQQGDD